MKWASMLLVLAMVGCGAVSGEIAEQAAPQTDLEAVLAACPNISRESVLAGIETTLVLQQQGFSFNDQLELLDDTTCGRNPGCRRCVLAELEWVYFGLLP